MIRLSKFFWITILTLNTSLAFTQSINIAAVGPTDICFGSVTLQVTNPVSGYQYNWYVGSYYCSGSNITSPSAPYAMGTTIQAYASGEFYCYGVPPNGGPWELSNFILVRALPGSVGSILMPRPYNTSPVTCQNAVTLCIPTAFYANFTTIIKWYKDNVQIPGASSDIYTANQTGWYKYSITSPCMTDYSDSVQVLIPTTLSSFTVSRTSPICNLTPVTLNVTNPVAGATYSWQVSQAGGTYYTVGTGTSYNYTVPSTTYINIRLIQNDNGCSRTTSAQTFQVTTLVSSISPTGTIPLCTGTVTLTATMNGTGGQWVKDGIDIPGATQLSYQITAPGYGIYSFRATGNCSGYKYSNNVTVVAGNGTVPVISASGPTSICSGNSVTLSTAVTNATYQWFKDNILINGATSSSVVVSTAGAYKVEVTQSGGCTYTSANTNVSVNSLPTATISTLNSTTFCAGGTAILSANSGGGLAYQWKKNGVIINGATNINYTATTTGTFKCMITDQNGCYRTSAGIIITVNALPTSTISAIGSANICSGDSVGLLANTGAGLNYQWKKYSNNIAGATNNSYFAKTTGTYKCVLTNGYGCSRTSNNISVSVVCREASKENPSEMIIYPNPSDGNFRIQLPLGNLNIDQITITDATGRFINFSGEVDETEVKISGLSPGCYIVGVKNENSVFYYNKVFIADFFK